MKGGLWFLRKALDRGAQKVGAARTRRLRARLERAEQAPLRQIAGAARSAIGRFTQSLAALPSLDGIGDEARSRPPFARHFQGIIEESEALARGEVVLIGGERGRISCAEDWHADPATGAAWPAGIPSDAVQLCPGDGAEVRRAWELGRCHGLVTAAQAWALTRDPAHLQTFQAFLEGFWEANPFGTGIHWACPMEVALRSINILTGLQIGARAGAPWPPAFLERCFQELYLSALAIRWNREWWGGYTNNHYLADLVGLCIALPVFRDDRWSRKTLAWARRELVRETGKQLGPDGWNTECSVTYHRLAVDLLFYAAEGLRLSPAGVPRELDKACRRSLLATLPLLREDGSLPAIGDNDGSHVLHLHRRPSESFRHFPAVAYMMGEPIGPAAREDSGEAEVLWLRGVEALRRFELLPPQVRPPHAAARDFGLYVFEEGPWRVEAVARANASGHAHGDLLALTAAYGGAPVFVDPGSAVYTSDLALRNLYRGTVMHTAASVDGGEHYVFPPRGPRARRAFGDLLPAWAEGAIDSGSGGPVFRGSHHAWAKQGITVSRRISVNQAKGALAVEDTVETSGGARGAADHLAEWHFHLGPNPARLTEGGEVDIEVQGRVLRLRKSLAGAFTIHESEWSPAFGVRRKGIQARFRTRGPGPIRCTFEVAPFPHDG